MKISDSHTDFLTELKTKREREEYISSLKNVKTLICAVFTTNKKFSMQDIENFKLELEILSRKYKINLLL